MRSRTYGLTRLSLPQLIDGPLVGQFSHRFRGESRSFRIKPQTGTKLVTRQPQPRIAIRAAEIVLGGPVEIEIASFEDITTALAKRLGDGDAASPDVGDAALVHADDDIESLRDLASGAPVVRAVNDLLEKAVETRASDIHIEPFRTGLVVRMRIDGMLRPVPAPAGVLPRPDLARQVLSGLNIAERRLPQDGAGPAAHRSVEIDIRIATMPTQHGEVGGDPLPEDRGLLISASSVFRADEAKLVRLLALPHGMIVTDNDGQRQDDDAWTMFSMLNETTRKILTIEDPVEYEIQGVNQTQVKPGIGLTFATALRAFVRQDPDVIMIGEIRDAETANIAIHAALTGHLVLTTLHTETAAAAVPRLLDLKVEGFLLRSTLRAVVAQRLVRVLCDRCKAPRKLAPPTWRQPIRVMPCLGWRWGDRA